MNIVSRIFEGLRYLLGGKEWRSVVRPGMATSLQMRKVGPDGQWMYRAPTEAESRQYLTDEAW